MAKDAVFYLIEYHDGVKATVAMGTGYSHEFNCGVAMRGQQAPFVITYLLQENAPFAHFEQLLRAIDHMLQTGKPAYPVERTLLTTGILDAVLHSWADDNRRMDTPQLKFSYEPADWPFAAGKIPPTKTAK